MALENMIAPNRIQCEMLTRQGKYESALPFAEKGLAATIAKVGKTDWRYQYFLMTLGKFSSNLAISPKQKCLSRAFEWMNRVTSHITAPTLQYLPTFTIGWQYRKVEPLDSSIKVGRKQSGKEKPRLRNSTQ